MRSNHFNALRRDRGFTLIELMIAMTLGLLLSIGLVTLFGATSKTNRVQNAMAQMQENGRYAVTRMNADLRLSARQFMNTGGYTGSVPGSNGAVSLVVAPQVYVGTITFPDANVSKPTGWDSTNVMAWWPLSPTNFMQGYDCTSGTCSPLVPTTFLPATGVAAGNRVQKADVLSVRYLNTEGWSYYSGEVTTVCAGASLTSVTLNSATSNFLGNDLAMLTSNGYAEIFQVSVAGTAPTAVLTPINVPNAGSVPCIATGGQTEITLFNFSRNFVTVTYWLKLLDDTDNPGRFIPTLMRNQQDNIGTATTSELVQGVEQMDFLYGMQASDGQVRYLTANQVSASAVPCPLPPVQYEPPNLPAGTLEPACLWRAVKSIEAHLLVDSVSDMFDLANPDMYYQYNGSVGYDGAAAPPASQQGGINFGHMMRREFVSLTSIRNYNP